MLNIRNVRMLVDDRTELQSESFSFGGSWYFVTIGANNNGLVGAEGSSFGIALKKWRKYDTSFRDEQRRDPTHFDTENAVFSTFIRYRASFTAAADPFTAADFENRVLENRVIATRYNGSSYITDESLYDAEAFPLAVARLALGPPPACPNLRISFELEHLCFGYDI